MRVSYESKLPEQKRKQFREEVVSQVFADSVCDSLVHFLPLTLPGFNEFIGQAPTIRCSGTLNGPFGVLPLTENRSLIFFNN